MKAKQRDVLKFIVSLDRQGTNLTKDKLLEKMNHFEDVKLYYIQLLLTGEIFEIGDVVFPLTTKNDRIFDNG